MAARAEQFSLPLGIGGPMEPLDEPLEGALLEAVLRLRQGFDPDVIADDYGISLVTLIEVAYAQRQAERASRVRAIVTRSDCWTQGSTVTYGGIARRDPLDRREIAKLDGSAEE